MKIKVIKSLNTRIGGPGTTFQKGVVRVPGEEIEVLQKVEGEDIGGNNVWYYDGNDKYYWSGGTNMASLYDSNANSNIGLIEYNRLIQNIPEEWRLTLGKGIKVVVMDSGINKDHASLKMKDIKLNKCFVEGLNPNDGAETNGHGTMVAGIIGGYGETNSSGAVIKGIRGLAPLCEIINYKISQDGYYFEEHIKKALIDLKETFKQEIVIVNCSWNIKKSGGLISAFEALPKNILCVCSAGNDEDLNEVEIFFPALIKNNISVGYMSDVKFAVNLNNDLEFFLILNSIMSCDKNNTYGEFKYCSMTTAIVSGICALYLSTTAGGTAQIEIQQLRTALRNLQANNEYETGLTIYNNKGSSKWA